jgi:hypothetical protein
MYPAYASKMRSVLRGQCTLLFQKILRKFVPETEFLEKIEQYKSILLPFLDGEQQRLLYPEKSSLSVDYRELDMQTLYILLTNICDIPAHEKGWGHFPNLTDMSLAANIDRIMEVHRSHSDIISSKILQESDWDEVHNKVTEISQKIEEILKGSRKIVTHGPGAAMRKEESKMLAHKSTKEAFLRRLSGMDMYHYQINGRVYYTAIWF